MDPTPTLEDAALNAVRVRITGVLPAQVRACIGCLTDDQIWWRPNPGSNSVGALVLHLSGAIMEFLCRRVGGVPYERQRDAEFAETRMGRDQLLQVFDAAIRHATDTFTAVSPSRLSQPSTIPDYYTLLFEDLVGVTVHMANHAGQIVFITKMLTEGGIRDLWSQTHRDSGAWRREQR
jgi:hypothetical protein